MRRRQFIGKAAIAGGGLLAGAGLVQELDNLGLLHEEPADWESTVRPEPVRGSARVWWSASPAVGRRLALTFDDGPTAQFTAEVLELLAARQVTATFFVVGALVRRHGDLARRIRDAGHELGNHTEDHLSAAVIDRAAVRDGVLRCSDAIEQLTGRRPRWFRPPRGEVTTATLLAAREAELDIALWSVGRGDAGDGDTAGVARHLAEAVHPGAVIDLHDGIGRSSWAGSPDRQLIRRRRAEISALPQVLARWAESGYTLDHLSDLIPPDAGSGHNGQLSGQLSGRGEGGGG